MQPLISQVPSLQISEEQLMPGMGFFLALKAQENSEMPDWLPKKGKQDGLLNWQERLQTFLFEQYSRPLQPPVEQERLSFKAGSEL